MAVVCNAIAFLHGFMWAQSPLPKMMPARVATFLVTVAFAAPGRTISVRNPTLAVLQLQGVQNGAILSWA